MRSPASIVTVSFVLALTSGYSTQALGQSAGEATCGLEQRLGPWRTTCHEPQHFSASVPAVAEGTETRMARVATFSVFGRSHFPSDRDNGAVWAGKGVSLQFAMGVGGSVGPLRYGVFPIVHWAKNTDFGVADTTVAGYSPHVYPWEGPNIDWPQRLGSSSSGHLSPGQSYLEVTGWWQSAVGVSTENIWWGPSKRYPMLFGATSDGFPHVYARSPTVSLGPSRTVLRVVFGRLTESDYFDRREDNDQNLIAALRWESAVGGVQVAVTSVIRQRWSPRLQFGEAFRLLVPSSTGQAGGQKEADGIGAVTVLLPVPSVGMKVHGTWGRGDFFHDLEDLLTEPEHNQFWAVGLHQDWQTPDDGATWSLSTEYASSVASPTQLTDVRGWGLSTSKTVYRHDLNKQGHSQRGQLLGPSIGPGTRATYASLVRSSDDTYVGGLVERILWDMDAFRRSVPQVPSDGQDREWLFGTRFGTEFDISGVPSLRLDAFAGASIRWNRQYVRFTGDLFDYPGRETNLWLDLRLAWTPDLGDSRE